MVISDNAVYDAKDFVVPEAFSPYVEKILLPRGLIVDRVDKLAQSIRKFYGDEEIHLICVLKGARSFFTVLLEALGKLHKFNGGSSKNTPFSEHYVRLKSYVDDCSSRKLTTLCDDLSIFKDKHVLIVEDIVDTGFTLTEFGKMLKAVGPKSMKVAVLTEKRVPAADVFKADFVGFSIPDVWVCGFGYDYNDHFRSFEHVFILGEAGKLELRANQ